MKSLSFYAYGISRFNDVVTVGSTTVDPLRRRFRSCRLLVSMCRLPALRRTIFPLPVLENRLLVPLWVFIFIEDSFG